MTTSKNILLFAAIIAVVVLLYLYVNKKSSNGTDCYDLPKDVNPDVFGPKYWYALHDITHKIPCPGCRGFAEKFMVFFHDVVNKKLGKDLYDRDNYNRMMLELNMPST